MRNTTDKCRIKQSVFLKRKKTTIFSRLGHTCYKRANMIVCIGNADLKTLFALLEHVCLKHGKITTSLVAEAANKPDFRPCQRASYMRGEGNDRRMA